MRPGGNDRRRTPTPAGAKEHADVMPGMNSGLNINDPQVVSAFGRALLHQGLIALLAFATLGVIWVTARAWLSANAATVTAPAEASSPGEATEETVETVEQPEPAARQLLRIGFGLIW